MIYPCEAHGCKQNAVGTIRYRFDDRIATVRCCPEHREQATQSGRVADFPGILPPVVSELVHDQPAPRRTPTQEPYMPTTKAKPPKITIREDADTNQTMCRIAFCSNINIKARGLCSKHHGALRKAGILDQYAKPAALPAKVTPAPKPIPAKRTVTLAAGDLLDRAKLLIQSDELLNQGEQDLAEATAMMTAANAKIREGNELRARALEVTL